mgnify:CR=1 FL=1
MAVANKNNFIDITKPQKVALPFNYIAYKNLILNTYPHFSIINKVNTRDCLMAVADGEPTLLCRTAISSAIICKNPPLLPILKDFIFYFNFPPIISVWQQLIMPTATSC